MIFGLFTVVSSFAVKLAHIFDMALFTMAITIFASLFFYIHCYRTNQIWLMMSLAMMGLTPSPLVHAIFLFALTIPLVALMAWFLEFFPNRSWVQLWRFYVGCVCTNRSWVQRWSTHKNILAPKVLIFPSNFKISFIAIVPVWPCRTHSNRFRFSKNMIHHRPMGSICWTSNPGSRGTKDTEFIRCVDVREPQIHKLWCLGLDNITRKVHQTALVEVGAGTVGEFTTIYLAENWRRILIIRKLSINGSVQFFLHSCFFLCKWVVAYYQLALSHLSHRLETRWYLQSELGS